MTAETKKNPMKVLAVISLGGTVKSPKRRTWIRPTTPSQVMVW